MGRKEGAGFRVQGAGDGIFFMWGSSNLLFLLFPEFLTLNSH